MFGQAFRQVLRLLRDGICSLLTSICRHRANSPSIYVARVLLFAKLPRIPPDSGMDEALAMSRNGPH